MSFKSLAQNLVLCGGKTLSRYLALTCKSGAVVTEASGGLVVTFTGDTLTLVGTTAHTGAVTVSTTLDVTGVTTLGAKLNLHKVGSAAASASGVLMGVGTAEAPAASATPDAKFVELRCKNSATSGDNRLLYMCFEQSGAAGGGECLRARSYGTGALGTARGAHISLELTAAGSITGLGVGCDSQLMIADALPAGGTYFAGQSEIWCAENSSIAAVTAHAIHSFKAAGNATAAATVLNAMAFQGGQGSGKMIYNANSTQATESNGSIRVLVDEGSGYVVRYLRYWDGENA